MLPRTYDPATRVYGNLYSNLLDYVISAALIFYILTIAGMFRLRQTRPDAERPYRAFGYPVVPALYIVGAATILIVLFVYRTGDDLARTDHRAARRAGVLSLEAQSRRPPVKHFEPSASDRDALAHQRLRRAPTCTPGRVALTSMSAARDAPEEPHC